MMKMFKGAPVKGAIIHGTLLLVMLVYGYKVWTKEKSTDVATVGSILLWNKPDGDMVAIEYASPTRTVRLERRGEGAGAYWWGLETKETPPPPTPPSMPTPGPLGPDGTGDGSAAPPKPGTPPGTPKPGTPPTVKPGTAGPRPGTGSGATTTPKPATTPPKPATTPPKPATTPEKPAAGSATPGPAKSPDDDAAHVLIARGPGDGSGSAGSASRGSATSPGSGSASGPGSAHGSGAGSGSGTTSTGPIDDPLGNSVNPDGPRPVSTTREFPVGDAADKVIKGLTVAHALRDLGKLTDELKKEYKLEDTSITLSVVMKSGTRSFVVGGSVYGGRDKYVLDTDSGKGYVLSGDLLSPFEQGESALRLTDPRGFAADSVHKVTVTASGKARTAMRIMAAAPAAPDPADPHAPPPTGKTKTWGDPASGKPDQTLANFIDNTDRLKPTKYEADLDPATLKEVVKLTYQDSKGATLGTVTLYKRDKPAEGAAPAATEYYVMTEKSRVPGFVPKGAAERVDQDVATVFPQ